MNLLPVSCCLSQAAKEAVEQHLPPARQGHGAVGPRGSESCLHPTRAGMGSVWLPAGHQLPAYPRGFIFLKWKQKLN